MKNNLKEKMVAGNSVLGTFMKLADPAVVEIFGLAGFDYVILDIEHGPNSFETCQNLIRAAELRGVAPIIRIYANEEGLVQRALDMGAAGVQVPQINTKEEALKLVKSAKFTPVGERGLCRYVRAADYSSRDKKDYFASANEETMVIGHIEGMEGIRNLDEILTTGLDVLFIGPYDLSSSLGLPGQVDHPLVVEKIKEVCEKAAKANVLIGTFADNVDKAHFYRDLGVKYISISVDVGIITDAARKIVKDYLA
ncbi:MAG: 2-dehydro-3-deoxyglucarate aldolase [Halanaerobiales bacterium]|nr:2-dehydro-3-deoxyglucarate aldolase [Halanaerobiales bacterium]